MNEFFSDLLAKLLVPQNWGQLLLLVGVVVFSWVLSRIITRKHFSARMQAYKTQQILNRLLTPLLILLILLVLQSVFRSLDTPRNIIRLAIPLALALIIIRATIYILRKSIPKAQGLKAWEGIIATSVWVIVALHILGWLPATRDIFENELVFSIGGKTISLLWVIKIILSLGFFLLLASWLSVILERQLGKRKTLTSRLRLAITKTARVILITLAVIVALDTIGVDITALTVLGGALGVGIGFGLQRIASNFISGFILLYDRSIRPGDVITIGNSFGWIQELRARYVVIRDRDGVDTLIPNENLITSQVINWSYSDKNVRQKLPLSVSYSDDPEKAMNIMIEAASEMERVIKDPPVVCRLIEFGDHGIKLELRYWIPDPEEGVNNIRSEISLKIWKRFKQEGITIPFPQRDVHIKDTPPSGM